MFPSNDATNPSATSVAKPPSKRLKRASSFEIEPIYKPYKPWRSTRNTSWAWARDWWAQTHHTPALTLRYYTHAVLPARMWERAFRGLRMDV